MSETITMQDIAHRTDFQDGLQTDVAVVGAGVSGLYTSYRLLYGAYENEADRPESVQIFDLNDVLGGRLLSITLPGMDVVGELGGMRYMTSQEIVTALIENVFKLPYREFPMGDPDHHLFYLRKQRFLESAFAQTQKHGQIFETRYFLNADDQGFSPDQLFNKVVYDVLSADPWFMEHFGDKINQVDRYNFEFKMTRRDWNQAKPNLTYCFEGSPFNGMKVNNIGFWNLIKDQISEEGYNFLASGGGYYSNTINWNAAEAFPYMVGDFSNDKVDYRTIATGYDQIAYALGKAYSQKDGSMMWMKNRLVTFGHNADNDYRYKLTFFNVDAEREWHVYANRIVLGMPRRSLELLDQFNFFFDSNRQIRLQDQIDSVIKEPSFKLLMGFTNPWWTDPAILGAHAGESITDLPMRQCYYFGVDQQNDHSLFLASYNDMRTVQFWQALMYKRDQFPSYEGFATDKCSMEQLKACLSELPGDPAPRDMVLEAMQQVRELHGPNGIPDPYIARLKDWAEDPYGGGYHAWKAKVNVKETMPYMRKPMTEEAIHIVGEAYSDQQGWVEGAFCVTELMLQDYFGMKWPEWLSSDYYLGW